MPKEKEEIDPKTKKAREKVEGKVKEIVEDSGVDAKDAQNIIGDITPPKNPDDPDEVRSFLSRIEEKLDRLLPKDEAPADDEAPVPEPEPPKKRPFIYWE